MHARLLAVGLSEEVLRSEPPFATIVHELVVQVRLSRLLFEPELGVFFKQPLRFLEALELLSCGVVSLRLNDGGHERRHIDRLVACSD